MVPVIHYSRRCAVHAALLICIANLSYLVYSRTTVPTWGDVRSQRNSNFPNTYISRIHLDLTSPDSYVTVTWNGPKSAAQNIGPFHSSPGTGWGTNDCNDPIESNCPGSLCTPKGTRRVEGFADYLKDHPESRYVTYIDVQRQIGFHSSASVPAYPASQGCVRLEPFAARLIHDNSIAGVTKIVIDGAWTNPRQVSK